MRFEITYNELFIFITLVWIATRVIIGLKEKKVSWIQEAKMLLVYICIVVIARFVNFPLHRVDGKIVPMKFDSTKVLPLWLNLIPIVHLFDVYDGWQVNIIGNITMFIPVGIIWPLCFKRLNTIGKTVLAGVGFTVCIEITQLLFYERCSDIDDVILNTVGVAIGAMIFFSVKKKRRHKNGF